MTERSVHRCVIAGILVLVSTSIHASDNCARVLSYGVFDTRTIDTAEANRDRLKLVFCKKESATYEYAKKEAESAGFSIAKVIDASGDRTKTETNYQSFRNSLCYDLDSSSSREFFLKADIKEASKVILDSYNQCLNAKGLKQSAIGSPSGTTFIWSIVYNPPGNVSTAAISVATKPPHLCKFKGKPIPNSIGVSAAGVRLDCNRNQNGDTLLIVNANAAEPVPVAITLGPLNSPKTEVVIGPIAGPKDMQDAISIPLPIGMICDSLKGVGWWKEGVRGTERACPSLTVGEGVAESFFDQGGHYKDNSGSCSYTFVCRPKPVQARAKSR